MTIEGPRRREFAELVADHIVGHQHRDELLSVIDAEGQPNELGRIVERRDQILTISFATELRDLSAFLSR